MLRDMEKSIKKNCENKALSYSAGEQAQLSAGYAHLLYCRIEQYSLLEPY